MYVIATLSGKTEEVSPHRVGLGIAVLGLGSVWIRLGSVSLLWNYNQAVSYFKPAYICDFMRVSTSGFTYESLLGCNLARWRH